MDKIHIRNLVVLGRHGGENERIKEQPFEINISLEVDISKAIQSDNLDDTINWATVRDEIIEVVATRSYTLMEKLAEKIAEKVLENQRVRSVEVSVYKIKIWDSGQPGVSIVRTETI